MLYAVSLSRAKNPSHEQLHRGFPSVSDTHGWICMAHYQTITFTLACIYIDASLAKLL